MTQRSGSGSTSLSAAATVLGEDTHHPGAVAVVGGGRLGSVLVQALHAAGHPCSGPHPRGYPGEPVDGIVLLCVPDAAIASAAALIRPGPLVGHCSGATGLSALGSRRGFSMHPVMTFTAQTSPDVLAGTAAAVAGTDPPALAVARDLARRLGMRPFTVAESDRTAYHAATAMAANFLVTLESASAALLRTAGIDRAVLLPLARAALENWGVQGAAALTGPVARGDRAVVDSHRQVIAARTPELLPMFDALVVSTYQLAQSHPDETSSSTRTTQ
jgi:predicted short-subunit dehydrogenase-like oxidoreductase (DUF2520 family)